jgi:hypothetical protein
MAGCEVQIGGSFTGTYQLQGSNDKTNWIQIGSDITAAGLYAVSKEWAWLRLVCTSFTSAPSNASVAGEKARKMVKTITVKTSGTGATGYIRTSDMRSVNVHIDALSSSTLQLQGSMDASTWTQIGADKTGEAQMDVADNSYTYVRINNSSDGSDTPVAVACGIVLDQPPTNRSMDASTPVATPSTPTVTPAGTTGSTTYAYKVVARNAKGHSAASSAGSTTSGNSSLSSSNKNGVTWSAVTGATSYDVYRTTGGATQGLIISGTTGTSVFDTGLTADGSTAPTARDSANTGVYVADLSSCKVVVSGSMTGTLDVEGSVDGTNYKKIGSSNTAAGVQDISSTLGLNYVRTHYVAYTSGTPTAVVVGNRRGRGV